MKFIEWDDFERVELRIGTIVSVENFPEAKKPAYRLKIDFGLEIGIKSSSAQITSIYQLQELVGKQIVGVTNFHPKKIGPFISECLVCGFYNTEQQVVLAVPDKNVPNGSKLC